jgi:pimeloyl-ACP methyl ester carboxylesterase
LLIMRGGASAILTRETAERMTHSTLGPAELVSIPMAGHAVMLDNPQATKDAVENFLLRVK